MTLKFSTSKNKIEVCRLNIDHGPGNVDADNRNDGKRKNIYIYRLFFGQRAIVAVVIFAVIEIVYFVFFYLNYKKKVLLYVRSCKLLCNGKIPKLLLLLYIVHI